MKQLIAALLLFFSVHSFAQSPVSARLSSGVDLGMAYLPNTYNPSLAYYQLINIGERKLVSVGWTLRLGAFYGDNLNYYTAPARLTRGTTGFSAITAPLKPQNIDTVRYDYVTMTSANAGLRVQFNLGRVELGASADLLGFTIGRWRTGRYRSSTGQYAVRGSNGLDSARIYFQGANSFQRSYPSRANLRLLGDNDIGTLSTEVYARLLLTQRFTAKVGYQWLTTEMTMANRDVVADNNRFRNRSGMVYLALSLPIFY